MTPGNDADPGAPVGLPEEAPGEAVVADHLRPRPVVGSGASPFGRRCTVHDLSSLTGVTPRTIKSWRTKGLIPPPLGPGRKGGVYYDARHLRAIGVVQRCKAGRLTYADLGEIAARVGPGCPADRWHERFAAERAAQAERKLAAMRGRRPTPPT